jgi:hypothetical protein
MRDEHMAKDSPVVGVIQAQGMEISVLSRKDEDDYISLTDLARFRNPEFPADVVKNWMRLRSTIEFLGLWEILNNPNFKLVEFDQFKIEAGANAFVLSPTKWIRSTGAIGIISKSGRYGGGTFAHKDIALEFASWLSPEFKLYVIKDYQRLKQSENHQDALDWSVKRYLSKINYRFHTDAVQQYLIPPTLTKAQEGHVYADEADLLNMALFGQTSATWRKEHVGKKGNMRDEATIEQLIVLANLEQSNSLLIEQGLPQRDRLKVLRTLAISQLQRIAQTKSAGELHQMDDQLRLSEVSE